MHSRIHNTITERSKNTQRNALHALSMHGNMTSNQVKRHKMRITKWYNLFVIIIKYTNRHASLHYGLARHIFSLFIKWTDSQTRTTPFHTQNISLYSSAFQMNNACATTTIQATLTHKQYFHLIIHDVCENVVRERRKFCTIFWPQLIYFYFWPRILLFEFFLCFTFL